MKSQVPDFTADFTEQRISSTLVYDGGLLKVMRDAIRLPDGGEAWREYVVHPGAVMMLAFLDEDTILLERQYRYPHGRHFIELPAGKLEPGEPHLDSARRELLEETGYVAREWTRLAVIHTAIAYTDEAIELFLAEKLVKTARNPEVGEFLETMIVPFAEAVQMIRDGRITGAKTVTGLLWFDKWGAAL